VCFASIKGHPGNEVPAPTSAGRFSQAPSPSHPALVRLVPPPRPGSTLPAAHARTAGQVARHRKEQHCESESESERESERERETEKKKER
jgi:hypothetical protein